MTLDLPVDLWYIPQMESIMSWSKRAKCRNEGVFQEKVTKKYCTGCPVMGLCSTYAIVHGERGIWGGTSDKDRAEVDQTVKEMMRERFARAGLLESRFSLLEPLVHQEVQLPEQLGPSDEIAHGSGPTSTQSLPELSHSTGSSIVI